MTPELKEKIHQLIESCNDDFLLEEARVVLESSNTGEAFWQELDDEDKESFLGTEEEHEQGHPATHSRLMHQFGEWKKK